jgi:hypothetical protein
MGMGSATDGDERGSGNSGRQNCRPRGGLGGMLGGGSGC